MLKFYSANGEFRASVDGDGAVRNATGAVVGFINPDGSAGNAYDFWFVTVGLFLQYLFG